MLTDGLILSLVFSGVLLVLGYKFKSIPMLFISSLGWMISALQIYQQTAEILPMVLLIMLSIGQFMIGRSD